MNRYYEFIKQAETVLGNFSEGEIVDLLLDNFYEFNSTEEARPIAQTYIKEYQNK